MKSVEYLRRNSEEIHSFMSMLSLMSRQIGLFRSGHQLSASITSIFMKIRHRN